MRNTLSSLRRKRAQGGRIAQLTAYDAGFARVFDDAGVDSILIGDSLGMVVQGHDSTVPVTIEDVAYHTACVARATTRTQIVADMPFGSYQESPAQALRNAVRLMQAGAQVVKLEGGVELAETIRLLVQAGVPVCGHVGLMPQQVHAMGGFRVQGKSAEQADRILQDALALEAAGAAMVVIEGVPEPVARRVCEALSQMLTIGIGASAACDGQVLVLHDMLGLTTQPARFVKDFTRDLAPGEGGVVLRAAQRYVQEVNDGTFPGPEHVYGLGSASEPAAYGGSVPPAA